MATKSSPLNIDDLIEAQQRIADSTPDKETQEKALSQIAKLTKLKGDSQTTTLGDVRTELKGLRQDIKKTFAGSEPKEGRQTLPKFAANDSIAPRDESDEDRKTRLMKLSSVIGEKTALQKGGSRNESLTERNKNTFEKFINETEKRDDLLAEASKEQQALFKRLEDTLVKLREAGSDESKQLVEELARIRGELDESKESPAKEKIKDVVRNAEMRATTGERGNQGTMGDAWAALRGKKTVLKEGFAYDTTAKGGVKNTKTGEAGSFQEAKMGRLRGAASIFGNYLLEKNEQNIEGKRSERVQQFLGNFKPTSTQAARLEGKQQVLTSPQAGYAAKPAAEKPTAVVDEAKPMAAEKPTAVVDETKPMAAERLSLVPNKPEAVVPQTAAEKPTVVVNQTAPVAAEKPTVVVNQTAPVAAEKPTATISRPTIAANLVPAPTAKVVNNYKTEAANQSTIIEKQSQVSKIEPAPAANAAFSDSGTVETEEKKLTPPVLKKMLDDMTDKLVQAINGISSAGGLGGLGSILPDIDLPGGGGKGGKPGKPTAKPQKAPGRIGRFLGKAGNVLKSAAPGLLKGGGLALGGLALGYGADKLKESGHEKLGGAADVGAEALTWGGTGAMLGSVIPGVGTAIGGGLGALGGAAYGMYKNWGNFFGKDTPPAQAAAKPATAPPPSKPAAPAPAPSAKPAPTNTAPVKPAAAAPAPSVKVEYQSFPVVEDYKKMVAKGEITPDRALTAVKTLAGGNNPDLIKAAEKEFGSTAVAAKPPSVAPIKKATDTAAVVGTKSAMNETIKTQQTNKPVIIQSGTQSAPPPAAKEIHVARAEVRSNESALEQYANRTSHFW